MEGLTVTWWMWFLLGLGLLLAEFLTPGAFYLFFFGLGAIAVGLLGAVGIRFSLAAELVMFLVFSLGLLGLLRKRLRLKFDSRIPEHRVDSLEADTALALEDIPAGGFGKAEMRGTVWNARNAGDKAIAKSERCRIRKIDGLTLWIASN